MFFSFRISSTRFSHSFMGQALFPVLRNRYYIVRRIDDIVILVSTRGATVESARDLCNDNDDDDNSNMMTMTMMTVTLIETMTTMTATMTQ